MPGILIPLTLLLAMAGNPNRNPAQDETAETVQAYYRSLCSQWADERRLQDPQRARFLDQCVADMAKTHPVGYDESPEAADSCH